MYWLNLNAAYDGDVFLTVILNGAIHTVMYAYYFLSLHTKVREEGGATGWGLLGLDGEGTAKKTHSRRERARCWGLKV